MNYKLKVKLYEYELTKAFIVSLKRFILTMAGSNVFNQKAALENFQQPAY